MDSIDIQRTEHTVLELLNELHIKGQLNDPRIPVNTCFVRVKLAKDMSRATIWVSNYTGPEHVEDAVVGLNAIAWKIQSVIGKRLHRKRTPLLTFKVDTSISKSESVLRDMGSF